MDLNAMIGHLGGKVIAGGRLDAEVTGCYVSDLLSDVLAHSDEGSIWVTQHTHPNIVAVAAVKGLAGVVIVGNKPVAADTVERAEGERVNLISTGLSAFEAAGRIYMLLEKSKEGATQG